VTDLAAILKTIAGYDELDSTSMRVPVPDYLAEVKQVGANGIKGLRIGVPAEYFIAGIDPEVERTVKVAIDRLSKLGAEIVNISLPHTEHALAVYYILAPAEASSNLARYDGVRYGRRAKNVRSLTELYETTRAEGFGAEVQRRILIGTYVLSAGYYDAYYLKAQQVRTLILDDFKAAFANKCDLIAAPVSPTTAFKLGEKTDSPLQMYLADVFTIPISLAGLPAMSIPIGMDAKNLPIGLQLIGPAFEELRLLKTAQLYLEQHPFDTRSMTKAHG
jgi:aspartyl-tRNA(Asn)/glutamyl-tRNA(Gln) amidotransferase subunit A